ncbi:lipoprotein-anchoring transpeptidase ErfK/SrfK [Phyllobacterium trifolii]|jgi:lipoprotein-anchoring transpeptidase ErfK/SrfK|uniref:Lipoprotein-anchoring transpeptidase ErfK/SrfK n=1 Tax=Phyllobacterium trifolii TaxID=300193 RepID=A0A839UJB2_9HYPH|nr:lipoprotein-anchoring transpeptidase ErfK/SrfK [Phyllobacterium trifolii]
MAFMERPIPTLSTKSGHRCVRLTNWDAEELAGMVKPGVVVRFVN